MDIKKNDEDVLVLMWFFVDSLLFSYTIDHKDVDETLLYLVLFKLKTALFVHELKFK